MTLLPATCRKKDGQWTRAKGFDSFCPLGPWIVRELSPGSQLQTFFERPGTAGAVGVYRRNGIQPRCAGVLH